MTTIPAEEVTCGGNNGDMTTIPDDDVSCGGNNGDMATILDKEITFGGNNGDMTTIIPDEKVTYERNIGVTTEQEIFEVPLQIASDDEYASSVSYYYSEEDYSDEDSEEESDEDVDEVNHDDDHRLGIYGAFLKGAEDFKTNRPSAQEWQLDWPEEEITESAWINVEETKYGGYGVIMRNMAAKPIAASVYFSRHGVTYLFQVLKGLNAGLELALKHGCSKPRVICNSRVVVRVLHHIASGFCRRPNCSSIKVNNVCRTCMMNMVPRMTDASFISAAPLFEKLQGKLHLLNFTSKPRKWNQAAYYLAIRAKATLLIYGRGFKEYKDDINPMDIPDELLEILYKDAYDSVYYNLEAAARIIEAG